MESLKSVNARVIPSQCTYYLRSQGDAFFLFPPPSIHKETQWPLKNFDPALFALSLRFRVSKASVKNTFTFIEQPYIFTARRTKITFCSGCSVIEQCPVPKTFFFVSFDYQCLSSIICEPRKGPCKIHTPKFCNSTVATGKTRRVLHYAYARARAGCISLTRAKSQRTCLKKISCALLLFFPLFACNRTTVFNPRVG